MPKTKLNSVDLNNVSGGMQQFERKDDIVLTTELHKDLGGNGGETTIKPSKPAGTSE